VKRLTNRPNPPWHSPDAGVRSALRLLVGDTHSTVTYEMPQIYIVLIELAVYAFVATFVAIVVLGHVLLAAAIIQCARDDLTRGRRIYGRCSALALRPFTRLLTRSTRSFLKSSALALRRREFITLLVGAAAAWPKSALGQQPEQIWRIGLLMNLTVGDPEGEARISAFLRALQQLGWTDGRNLRIDYRWAAGDAGHFHRYAEELLALAPDVILASATPSIQALQQATRTVPIVFVNVADPVGAGFVESLARPGGNATGFTPLEYGIGAKWLELLKEIAPGVTRVAVLRDLTLGLSQLGAIQTVAPSFGVELRALGVREAGEIERDVAAFARYSNGGLIVTASTSAAVHRNLITMLAARHRLPTVYSFRYFVTVGGLISYGANSIDQFRRAAGYVDRILRGEKPADLPVQAPTKYELVINLKTAKALGLDLPPTVLARADEVIE
jgi:ABC-type uncharacterized transport system substrate-binding protein